MLAVSTKPRSADFVLRVISSTPISNQYGAFCAEFRYSERVSSMLLSESHTLAFSVPSHVL